MALHAASCTGSIGEPQLSHVSFLYPPAGAGDQLAHSSRFATHREACQSVASGWLPAPTPHRMNPKNLSWLCQGPPKVVHPA